MAEERISLEDETPLQGYSDRMERISLEDTTLFVGYSNHIQRYAFAAQYCAGRRVLDAGCGSGYGSAYLIDRGSANVTAIDISDAALAEANRLFRRDKLRFVKGDLECLSEMGDLGGPFDVVVNLENIEHLAHPDRFLEGARRQLTGEGAMVISTPNGVLTARDEAGRNLNRSHVQEFTEAEFRELLGPYFNRLELFGQWKTPERQVRIDFEHHLFENLCELYYSPGHRPWRASASSWASRRSRPRNTPPKEGAIRSISRSSRWSPPPSLGRPMSSWLFAGREPWFCILPCPHPCSLIRGLYAQRRGSAPWKSGNPVSEIRKSGVSLSFLPGLVHSIPGAPPGHDSRLLGAK